MFIHFESFPKYFFALLCLRAAIWSWSLFSCLVWHIWRLEIYNIIVLLSTLFSSSCCTILSFSSWYFMVRADAFPKTSSLLGKSTPASFCHIRVKQILETEVSKLPESVGILTFSMTKSPWFSCSKLSSEKRLKSISVLVFSSIIFWKYLPFLHHLWTSGCNLHQSYPLLPQLLPRSRNFPFDVFQVLVDHLVDHHLNPVPESPGPLLGSGVALHGMLVSSLHSHN